MASLLLTFRLLHETIELPTHPAHLKELPSRTRRSAELVPTARTADATK
jgi:hypothetical protein